MDGSDIGIPGKGNSDTYPVLVVFILLEFSTSPVKTRDFYLNNGCLSRLFKKPQSTNSEDSFREESWT